MRELFEEVLTIGSVGRYRMGTVILRRVNPLTTVSELSACMNNANKFIAKIYADLSLEFQAHD